MATTRTITITIIDPGTGEVWAGADLQMDLLDSLTTDSGEVMPPKRHEITTDYAGAATWTPAVPSSGSWTWRIMLPDKDGNVSNASPTLTASIASGAATTLAAIIDAAT